jgi:3-oxoacyl-[acyl-carrier protein] reductase/meso-butanediol dehydrogenase/(S,S)-butanediol dehydrogenase/diacetyl reductase
MPSRTVCITGGSRGLGAALADAFAAQGDQVIVGSRTAPAAASDRICHVEVDVRQPAALRAFVDRAIERTGRLDVFVNNAGFSAWRRLERVDEAFWATMIDTNLKGTFFGCQAAAERLAAGGCIINVSSLAGRRGSANNSVYCASKFAVNGVTQALAKELGPRGIRVNAVCPVYIRTEGLLEALAAEDAPPLGSDVNEYLATFSRTQSALGCLPDASQVARTCVFLASGAASAITGQCVHVDCGVLPQ